MVVLGSFYGGTPKKFEDRYSTDVVDLEGITTGTGAAIGAGVGAVVGGAAGALLSGTEYTPYNDYVNGVARSDARVELGSTIDETLVRTLLAGWIPIYCSDSEITRNNILREFASRGWQGKGWWQRYHKGGGNYTHWYGATFNITDAPQTIVQQAVLDGTKAKTVLVAAKQWMRSQGGTENYDEMARLAAGSVVLARRVATAPSAVVPPAVTPPVPVPAPDERQMGAGAGMPWFKKWWVWALIVGGTATVSVGGYMLYRRLKRSAPAQLPAGR